MENKFYFIQKLTEVKREYSEVSCPVAPGPISNSSESHDSTSMKAMGGSDLSTKSQDSLKAEKQDSSSSMASQEMTGFYDKLSTSCKISYAN